MTSTTKHYPPRPQAQPMPPVRFDFDGEADREREAEAIRDLERLERARSAKKGRGFGRR